MLDDRRFPPAFAEVDIEIAVGTGPDIAMRRAAATLAENGLAGIVLVRNLSRAKIGNIRQNLLFASTCNVLGVPIAASIV